MQSMLKLVEVRRVRFDHLNACRWLAEAQSVCFDKGIMCRRPAELRESIVTTLKRAGGL